MKSYPIVTLSGTDISRTPAQPVVAKTSKPTRPLERVVVEAKPAIQPVSDRFPALEEQEIKLTYFAPLAREVKVAGNFNGWRPDATPLKNTGAGEWVVSLMLRSGQYEYRFIVDGRWIEDPQAAQRMANPHGGFISVLTVPLSVRTSIL